jgi:hypothetical protein
VGRVRHAEARDRATAADLLNRPDPLAFWIRLDLITRRVVGRRMNRGATPESDEMLDRLIVLRTRVARRLAD